MGTFQGINQNFGSKLSDYRIADITSNLGFVYRGHFSLCCIGKYAEIGVAKSLLVAGRIKGTFTTSTSSTTGFTASSIIVGMRKESCSLAIPSYGRQLFDILMFWTLRIKFNLITCRSNVIGACLC